MLSAENLTLQNIFFIFNKSLKQFAKFLYWWVDAVPRKKELCFDTYRLNYNLLPELATRECSAVGCKGQVLKFAAFCVIPLTFQMLSNKSLKWTCNKWKRFFSPQFCVFLWNIRSQSVTSTWFSNMKYLSLFICSQCWPKAELVIVYGNLLDSEKWRYEGGKTSDPFS